VRDFKDSPKKCPENFAMPNHGFAPILIRKNYLLAERDEMKQ